MSPLMVVEPKGSFFGFCPGSIAAGSGPGIARPCLKRVLRSELKDLHQVIGRYARMIRVLQGLGAAEVAALTV
jgi:hypothetical protein